MKNTHLITACLLLAFTGCGCGQNFRDSRWNPFNCFRGQSNVGAPCASGTCSSVAPPVAVAPAYAGAGCETCGTGVQSMGYEGYPSSYDHVVGGYEGAVQGTPVYGGESVMPMRAN